MSLVPPAGRANAAASSSAGSWPRANVPMRPPFAASGAFAARPLPQQAPPPGLDDERALLQEGVEEAAAHLRRERYSAADLHLGEVAVEVAAPHDLLVELEDDGIGRAPLAAGRRGERG